MAKPAHAQCERERVTCCFEPSQPQWIISELKTDFNLLIILLTSHKTTELFFTVTTFVTIFHIKITVFHLVFYRIHHSVKILHIKVNTKHNF